MPTKEQKDTFAKQFRAMMKEISVEMTNDEMNLLTEITFGENEETITDQKKRFAATVKENNENNSFNTVIGTENLYYDTESGFFAIAADFAQAVKHNTHNIPVIKEQISARI